VDELDLFRNFRRGVRAPSEDAQRRASALLARAVAREQSPGRRLLGLIGKRASSLLVLAVLAGATAVALFISTPWSSSPSVLERAQAALTPPQGTILHEKWEETTTSDDPACTVTRTGEIWIDQADAGVATLFRTHRFRGLFRDPNAPYPDRDIPTQEFLCSPGSAYEVGGIQPSEGFPSVLTGGVLQFVPPNRLVRVVYQWNFFRPDPVADLRRAIRTGRARDEGRTTLNGRTVERIHLDLALPGDPSCFSVSCPPAYAYVDPETFYPVEIHLPGDATRFATFEYLPRTAANLALTNIRAQHPHATGP
jgi:hypothetical protein